MAVAIQSSSAVALELYEGRLSQFLLVFFLLALSALVRLLYASSSRRDAATLGVCAAATALVYWYAGLCFLLAASALVAAGRIEWSRSRVLHLALGAVVGAVLVTPFVWDLAGHWGELPGMSRNTEGGPALTNLVSNKSGVDIATENSRWWLLGCSSLVLTRRLATRSASWSCSSRATRSGGGCRRWVAHCSWRPSAGCWHWDQCGTATPARAPPLRPLAGFSPSRQSLPACGGRSASRC